MSYEAEFRRSIEDPKAYWEGQTELISWYKKPGEILTKDNQGNDAWYVDGELNSAYLALDYHIEEGRGEQLALIYDSPVTNSVVKYTYSQLRDEVACFAGALKKLGVVKGDRIVIYMPMIPQTVIGMLACARLGAIHSVVFGGFAAKELATRIDDATPRLILSASCGIEFDNVIPYKPLVDDAILTATHTIAHHIVFQRSQLQASLTGSDLDWQALLNAAEPTGCVPVKSQDPLYILYTSGTTGKPKGVVRDNGGHAVALRYSLEKIYDVGIGDVFWAASDVGWVVGHSYIVYGPLFNGCTTILFEGKPVRTPDAGAFWRVLADHKVNLFFAAPTGFRAIKKEDPKGKLLKKYDLSSLKYLFVAGERTDLPTYEWLCKQLNFPVIDHWWQTESGWPMASNPMGIEVHEPKPGSATFPVPGYDVQILAPDQSRLKANEEGDVVIKLPLPPGCLPTVWGDHGRYIASYLSQHPGYYHTGDGGFVDEDAYLFIMGRTDDVINVAGHRLSTGEMEEIVASHTAVAECAVMGIEDVDKGQVPVGLLLLKDGVNTAEAELEKELVALVRKEIGAFANFKRAVVVERLPKTRSGKILRQILRKIADGRDYEPPATIDDPLILKEIEQKFLQHKIGLIGRGS